MTRARLVADPSTTVVFLTTVGVAAVFCAAIGVIWAAAASVLNPNAEMESRNVWL